MNEQLPERTHDISIETLINNIQNVILEGKDSVHNAVEEQKKITYWNIGKLIKEHLLENKDKADYGKFLFIELSKNLNITRTTLYQSVQFFEEYPSIVRARGRLTWSHYRTLFTIEDTVKRKEYEEKIIEDNLTTRELQDVIRKDKGLPLIGFNKKPLSVINGMPYSYKIKSINNKKVIDLGFDIYTEIEMLEKIYSLQGDINIDDIAEVQKLENTYVFKKAEKRHFTYTAYVEKIIDGDTIKVMIDLGFNTWTGQILRLRGINAEELGTPKGDAAKMFVEERLFPCKFIALKTYWFDRYKRYIADVFYDQDQGDILELAQNGVFLNQELIDNGLAVRY